MDLESATEPVWTAEDEATGCSVCCVYDRNSLLFIVKVSKGGQERVEYFPAQRIPQQEISEKDFLQAKQIAVKLADELVQSEG